MDIDATIDRAVEFLLSARVRGGWWQDFDTTRGLSDEWVTGYVGAALAAVPRAQAAQAAREAWRLLMTRRRWSEGWGFNPRVPPDADSTQCVLRLAHAIGAGRSPRARRGHRLLARHIQPSGGIATYSASGPALFYLVADNLLSLLQRRPRVSFRGWSAAHVCVTAAAACLPELSTREPVRAYLRRTQAPDGSWSAYWWSDREYPTASAAEALAMNPLPRDLPHLRSAIQWADGRLDPDGALQSAIQPDGSPFATACCLRLLTLSPDEHHRRKRLERSLDWLSRQQRADGSWAPSAALRVPPIDLVDADQHKHWVLNGRGYGTIRFDQNGVFTTATVVEALQIARAGLAVTRNAGLGTS